jgi:hypothetical protein
MTKKYFCNFSNRKNVATLATRGLECQEFCSIDIYAEGAERIVRA